MINNICGKCKKDFLSFVISNTKQSYCSDCKMSGYRFEEEKRRIKIEKMRSLKLDNRIIAIRNDRSRDMAKVKVKCELIKELREVQKLSFPAIGKLLDNHHTTILYLYYKHKDGYSHNRVK